ncbi:MAG TPA: hypothetical protein VJA26_05420 [Gammaproteobacteria bacterium]|nr:hypothetical protein [Gammaproteobacteria bacterium]
MIIEITPQLVLQALRPGNEIHTKIEQGIGPGYELVEARINEQGNLVLGLKHENDETLNEAPYALTFTSLECGHAAAGAEAEPEAASKDLLTAVARFVDSHGGKTVVVGGIQTEQWPDDPFRFKVTIQCTGKPPVSREGPTT